MSEHPIPPPSADSNLTEATERSLLDQLLSDAKLYTRSEDFLAVMACAARMRNFAPFNALLLQIQKPGVMYAASAMDWRERFKRFPKEGARPLLILWPFGPVVLVYDVADTEGEPLPAGMNPFAATGDMDAERLAGFAKKLARRNIAWHWLDAGDGSAGYIRVVQESTGEKIPTRYRMFINQNHDAATQFTTVVHELGHLFLGHLGQDRTLKISPRPGLCHADRELEAELVAYLVCARNGIHAESERYLAGYVQPDTRLDRLDMYAIMRAAGQVEALLGLTSHTQFDKPQATPLVGPPQQASLFRAVG